MGATPSTWNFGSTGLRWSEIADFEPIFACRASTVIPSEKVQLTLIYPRYALSNEPIRWTSYVAPKPPKRGSKTQNDCFPSKIALFLKKVCYKVSFCDNCQRQSCSAFICLHAKMIGGGRPLKRKFCIKHTTTWRGCRALTNCDEFAILHRN